MIFQNDRRYLGAGFPHQHADIDAMLAVLRPRLYCTWLFDRIGDPRFLPMLWSFMLDTQRRRANCWAALAPT